jgi:hypothetical protein
MSLEVEKIGSKKKIFLYHNYVYGTEETNIISKIFQKDLITELHLKR